MNLLLDTHLLLWAAALPNRLSDDARDLLDDATNALIFSVVSIWEVAIKNALGRADFQVNPGVLRRELLDNGYLELPIAGSHVVAVDRLPPLHRDPFDRLLIAQAQVEGFTLLTADAAIARYPGAMHLR